MDHEDRILEVSRRFRLPQKPIYVRTALLELPYSIDTYPLD